MLKLKIELDEEELDLLKDMLETFLEVEETTLTMHIESDQTPETIDEFMNVVSDQQDRVAAIRSLQQRLGA